MTHDDHGASPTPRSTLARLAAGAALTLGIFAVLLAWFGAVVPLRGDVGVVAAAGTALTLTALAARCRTDFAAEVAAWVLSFSFGAGVGLAVLGWQTLSGDRLPLHGVGVWCGAGGLRAACALPLLFLLRRGAPRSGRDALDRVMLGGALWLLASLVEASLVTRLARGSYSGLAGPGLGVALFALVVLSGLWSLAALARSARWLALWARVGRGDGWRVVDAASWTGAAPAEAWFDGLGPCDGVAVRTVAREGQTYREGDVAVALGRVPTDVARVTRGLRLRAFAAAALLAAVAVVTVTLVAPLRW